MLDGALPVEAGGMATHIRQSLDLAAGALAERQAIPQGAQDLMAKPVFPH